MRPNVFTIPPGAPFLATFAREFCAGKIIPGLSGADPLALARATIYVPTRRAARALVLELAVALDRPAVLLPRIRPLGGLEETERGLMLAGGEPLELPPPMGDIERRMILAELVLNWGRALRHAIVRIGPHGDAVTDPSEAMMVATHFAGAWHLAGELAGLLDEMIIEDVAWKKLDGLGGGFDEFWRITLNFLDIAITNWPDILRDRARVDPARHQVRLVEAQIAALESGRDTSPVIAIGSTGTNRATARLLASIARLPNGAVVLPGLDQGPAAHSHTSEANPEQLSLAAGHPQAALHRLLPVLGLESADVTELGLPAPELAARARFLSQALRPADTTELWGTYLATAGAEIPAALAGISLVEARDEGEEALALAIAMREVMEEPGATSALVTPNRDLATRVRAELLRWQIEVDDSGGDALGITLQGSLARLALACADSRHAATDVIALLSHPGVLLGRARAEVARLAPLVEAGVLRVTMPTLGLDQAAELIGAARRRAQERHANPAQKRITHGEWDDIAKLLGDFNAALSPLDAVSGEVPLANWLEAHRTALLALGWPGNGATQPGGAGDEVLAQLFEELEGAASPAILFDCTGYRRFFETLARETIVRGPQRAHPRVKILGLLEARLIHADVMLLGGLDETIWPPQAQTDSFLNRTMREKLGLSSPERRIGQTAHDFVQALCAGRAIVSRAAKRGGTPMVASRFVQRMAALAGSHWDECRARGQKWLELARAIDTPKHIRPPRLQKPRPCPPVALRPSKLSITRIETLRRDPYSIFASEILSLVPLDPLGPELGAREMGLMLHEVLAGFTRLFPSGDLPAGVRPQLLDMARNAMQPLLANAAFRAFQWPRVERALDFYLAFEAGRRASIAEILAEQYGTWPIALDDGSVFTLSGIADRLEIGRDGTVQVVDFKTGAVPSGKEVKAGFAPQLTLEAMMVDCGAFRALPAGSQATGATYLKLGGGADGGKIVDLRWKDATFGDVVADHCQELNVLLNQFRLPQTPYLCKPFVKFVTRFGNYDHLARFKEWASAGGEDTA